MVLVIVECEEKYHVDSGMKIGCERTGQDKTCLNLLPHFSLLP